MDRRQFVVGAGGTLALIAGGKSSVFAQSTPAIPNYYPPEYMDIIEASKSEGKLLVYANVTLEQWRGVLRRFNALYPWIQVETLDLGASELVERYLAEAATGSETCDLLCTSAPDALLRLLERNQVVPYESPEAPHLPEWTQPEKGLYTFAAEPQLMIWNKALLPSELVPAGFADLVAKVKAHPEVFNGKMTTYGATFGSFGYCAAYALVNHHGEKAWEWLDVLGPVTRVERSSGPMVEKVTSGEYLLGYNAGWATPSVAARDPARAEIFDWKLVEDGQVFMICGIMIPQSSQNSNSAKLWLDLVLSHEGQTGLLEEGRAVIRREITAEERGDRHTYESLAAIIGEENLIRVEYDPKMVTGYDAFIDRWKQAYGI